MKTVRVTPELVESLLAYLEKNNSDHVEGHISLEITRKSWKKFEKAAFE